MDGREIESIRVCDVGANMVTCLDGTFLVFDVLAAAVCRVNYRITQAQRNLRGVASNLQCHPKSYESVPVSRKRQFFE